MVSIEHVDNTFISHSLKFDNSRIFKEIIGINFDAPKGIVYLGGKETLLYVKIPTSYNSILYMAGIMEKGKIKEWEGVLIEVTGEEKVQDNLDNFLASKIITLKLTDLKRKITDEYVIFE